VTSTDGGVEWGAPHRLSTELQREALAFTSPDGDRAAVLWTESLLSMKWVHRGFAAATQPPSAPRSVTNVRKVRALQVKWEAPLTPGSSAVTSYRATATPGGRSCRATAPALTCIINGLTPGQSYTVAVEARNAAHDGWSAPGTSTPIVAAGPPAAVTGVTVTRSGRGKAVVRWVAPTNTGGVPLTAYRISYRAAGDPRATVRANLPATLRSVTISGLTPGKSYTFTVFAENAVASSQGAAAKPYKAS
jgi:hypothetical protein